MLEDSSDYEFVHVEAMGRVNSYKPRTSRGIHQHLIVVKPTNWRLVHVPVVFKRLGSIQISITGRCQVEKDTKTLDIEVITEGAKVALHTSLLLDLRTQAYLVKFLDLNVTEDPVIPYQEVLRFLFGSPSASVSLIGDVVGTPSNIDNLVDFTQLGIDSGAESGELLMFNFAFHLYTLIYLRLTNQLTENKQVRNTLLEALNRDYVKQLTYFDNFTSPQVSFAMFQSEASVWFTAYCARVYADAQYADWENDIYIDPKILHNSVSYLLKHQHLAFDELHGSFQESFVNSTSSPRLSPVALTSHVLIALVKISEVSGSIQSNLSNAKKAAVEFLERKLYSITSEYEIAITTYALMEAGSVEAKIGFNMLESVKRISEGMIYWSPTNIRLPSFKYQVIN